MMKEFERNYYRIYMKDLITGAEGYANEVYFKEFLNKYLSKTKGICFEDINDVDEFVEKNLSNDFEFYIEIVKEKVKMSVKKQKYYNKRTRDEADKCYQKILNNLRGELNK